MRFNAFNYSSHYLTKTLALMVMWLYGLETLILGHHAANFGGFRHCGSGDKTFLIFHEISKGYILSHHLAIFGGHRRCGSKDITDLIIHVTLQNPVIKCPFDFMEGSYSLYIHSAKFVSHRHCASAYLMILVCHIISQDHVIIWSFDFMGRSRSR